MFGHTTTTMNRENISPSLFKLVGKKGIYCTIIKNIARYCIQMLCPSAIANADSGFLPAVLDVRYAQDLLHPTGR